VREGVTQLVRVDALDAGLVATALDHLLDARAGQSAPCGCGRRYHSRCAAGCFSRTRR
jgi:hypothetical protein